MTTSFAEHIVFKADYDVYWKGWPCGVMHAEFKHLNDKKFSYQQEIKSTLFFYNFHQLEISTFILEDFYFIPEHYKFYKDQSHKEIMAYEIAFNADTAYLHYDNTAIDDQVINIIPPYYDNLLLQLQLIQQLRSHHHKNITLAHVDHQGVHTRDYRVHAQDDGLFLLTSVHKKRMNTFTLSPEKGFFPVVFEQTREGKPIIRGVVRNVEFNPQWFTFGFMDQVSQ